MLAGPKVRKYHAQTPKHSDSRRGVVPSSAVR
jgi:hypothetical protein